MSSPSIAQKAPYLIEVEAGKTYYWCSCGLSQEQPFCDGSHKTTDLVPLPYVATETNAVAMCGCKYSGTKPICDGSHKSL
jgi:CDGSH iron-sulfur domain-containing protein 3